ncbi:MAG: GIY-YIG nuclease family protein [Candidatus Paceibacterota bacterium]
MKESYFLYVLRSDKAPRHYIGISENPLKRLNQHNGGLTKSTKPYRPWRLVYQLEYASKTEARKREVYLKRTARARKELFDSIDRVR